MATAVQLELIVDEKGAVQGVRAFDAAVKGSTGSVNQLDASLQKLNTHLTQTGQHAQGVKQIGDHAITSLDKVRLLRDDLDIRIPRAMEKIIAKSQAAMAAINAMGTALVGFGAGMVAFSLGKEVYDGIRKVWDGYLSLTKAAEDYQATVAKAKEQDFVENIRSVETLTARWKEAHTAAEGYANVAEAFRQVSWSQLLAGDVGGAIASRVAASSAAGMSTTSTAQADAMRRKAPEFVHRQQLAQIELNHALDSELQGHAKINAELAKKRDLAAADRQYTEALEKQRGNTTPSDAGKTAQQQKDALAAREAEAENFVLSREHALELGKLRAQAAEAGMKGEQLYAQQEKDAIAELRGTDKDTIDFRNAIHEKFHKEELARLEDEGRALQKLGREATASGMTGVAKIRFEGQSRVNEIDSDTTHGAGYKAYAVAAANTQTNNQILSAEQEFTQRVDALADQSATHQISGFARIRADGQKQIDALRVEFEKLYGKDASNADYLAHVGELNRGIGAVNAGSRDQTAELAQRNTQETEQIEAAARIKFLSAEKQKTAAIQQEYSQRLQKYKEELQQQEISQDDFNRRVTAAQQEMDAELADAAREAREKIASELSGLIGAHPLEALQKMGEKFASQAGAALLQRGASHFGGMPNTGSLLDKIAGIHNPDQRAEMPGGRHGAGAAGLISVQSATIHVMSANIVGGGGGRGGSTTEGGWGGGLFSGSGSGGGSFSGGGWSGGSGASGSPGSMVPAGGAPPPGMSLGGAMKNVGAGVSTANDLRNLFRSGGGAGVGSASVLANAAQPSGLDTTNPQLTQAIGGGTLNPDGSVTKSAFGQSMIGGGMTMANTLGAAGAGLGLFSASKQGGLGGTLGGAMSGAQLGMEVGGPIGAAVGAVGGALVGFFGGGEQARVWWLKQGRPRLANDVDSFEHGSMDYLSAYMDMEQLKTEAHQTLSKMGFTGSQYYHGTVTGEISQEEAKLSREQRAGRSAAGVSTGMYASGTDSVPAMLSPGERVIPTDQNERITRALESGAMHQSYRAAMQTGSSRAAAPVQSPTVQLHLHSQSSRDIFMAHATDLRAAITKSYGDYGGSADGGF